MSRPNKTIGRDPRAAAERSASLSELKKTDVSRPANSSSRTLLPKKVKPSDMAKAIEQAKLGLPAKFFSALDFFYRIDDEIAGAVSSLIEAVLQGMPQITPVDDSPEAERQVEDFKLVQEKLDLTELLREALENRFYGFNAAYLPWDAYTLDNGHTIQGPTTYELLPRDWIYAKKENSSDEQTVLHVGDRPIFDYPNGSILLFTERKLQSFTDVDFTRYGVGMACARFAVYAYFNWEDWAGYNEVFGVPTVLGTLLQGWNKDDKELLQQAVWGIGNDARGIISDKAKIDTIEAGSGGNDVFQGFGSEARLAIARIIKSESLTDNMNGRGSNAAMLTVNGVRLDVARGMANRLSKMLQRRLVDPFCQLNYGRCLIRINLPVHEVKNLVEQLTIDKGLSGLGLELSERELRARYQREAPEDEEDTIAPGGSAASAVNIFGG